VACGPPCRAGPDNHRGQALVYSATNGCRGQPEAESRAAVKWRREGRTPQEGGSTGARPAARRGRETLYVWPWGYMTSMVFLMLSVVSDLGRSSEKPRARLMVNMGSTPIARPTPNMTV